MMPSLPKLIALAAVLWVVWTLFRMFERRKDVARQPADDQQSGGPSGATGSSDENKAGSLDLEECSVCRAWVAGTACNRSDCPYG